MRARNFLLFEAGYIVTGAKLCTTAVELLSSQLGGVFLKHTIRFVGLIIISNTHFLYVLSFWVTHFMSLRAAPAGSLGSYQ